MKTEELKRLVRMIAGRRIMVVPIRNVLFGLADDMWDFVDFDWIQYAYVHDELMNDLGAALTHPHGVVSFPFPFKKSPRRGSTKTHLHRVAYPGPSDFLPMVSR